MTPIPPAWAMAIASALSVTVYADADGNVGFTIPARIPIRANGNGGLPVPGDTDQYEWKGYIRFDDLPRVLNPAGGIIATANARTVGPAYNYYLSDRWAAPYRTERMYELLSSHNGFTPDECNSVQNDIVSLPNKFLASQLIAAAHAKTPADPRLVQLIDKLNGWDGRATTNSVETSFLEYARHILLRTLLEPYLGSRVTNYELWDPESVYNNVWWRDKVFLENLLRARPAGWLPKGFASYDDLLIESAAQAVETLEQQTKSADAAAWNWGRLHVLDISHPLGRVGLLHRYLSIGAYESNGTIDTVRAMGNGHGPANRFVTDLSNWDNSLMEITTGESGQAVSAYYRDQFPEWFAGRGIAAPFSSAAEERVRAHRLYLLPGSGAPSK